MLPTPLTDESIAWVRPSQDHPALCGCEFVCVEHALLRNLLICRQFASHDAEPSNTAVELPLKFLLKPSGGDVDSKPACLPFQPRYDLGNRALVI